MASFDQTPDKPQPFGFKISWFALKASDPASVLAAIEATEARLANWASGLAAAYGNGDAQNDAPWIFVSPPLGGWILAVSASLPYPVAIEADDDIGRRFDVLFSRLMKRFDDVQFFASHRVSDFAAWARALNGKPVRVFGYADGGVLENLGEQTAEEAKLGLADLTDLTPSDATDKIFALAEETSAEEQRLVETGLSLPDAVARAQQECRDPFPDESAVVALAGLWSIDPMQLSEQDHPPGLGLVARLPEDLTQ